MEAIYPANIHEKIMKRLGDITRVTYPQQGHTSEVAIIETNTGKFVVKHSKGKQYRQWLTREAFVLKCLEKVEISVPKLIDFVIDTEADQAWLLMEHLEGVTLRNYLVNESSEKKRQSIIRHFGQTLREIHLIECPKEMKSKSKWIDLMLDQAAYNLYHYKVDGSKELLEHLENNRPAGIDQTLIHGDFTLDNVLVKDGKINAIIDWSGGAFGDPRYDAALAIRPKMNAFQTSEDFTSFFEGYGKELITEKEFSYFEEGLYEFF